MQGRKNRPDYLIEANRRSVEEEYQNRNAIDIAEIRAKLCDKFVGFIENLADVGEHLDKTKGKYDDAFKQLSTGKDNLTLRI